MTATSANVSMTETPGVAWRKHIPFAMIGALSQDFIDLAGRPVGLAGSSLIGTMGECGNGRRGLLPTLTADRCCEQCSSSSSASASLPASCRG